MTLTSWVAPFAGAWIEIQARRCLEYSLQRRTLRGCVDWNYFCNISFTFYSLSHPSRVRGLKLPSVTVAQAILESRTLRGCVDWNKKVNTNPVVTVTSHPSRVRGLKLHLKQLDHLIYPCRTLRGCVDWNYKSFLEFVQSVWSHPSRVRGLKSWSYGHELETLIVAPFAGAWIEIPDPKIGYFPFFCRTLRGCVDWNIFIMDL